MTTMTETPRQITGGVDTHRDVHVVAALDEHGGILDTNEFPATAAGYHDLLVWLSWFGPIDRVGVEGTGTYGAGLTRHLLDHDVEVIEVDRPNRQRRRRAGKSDTTDAISTARAALSGQGVQRRRRPTMATWRSSTCARGPTVDPPRPRPGPQPAPLARRHRPR